MIQLQDLGKIYSAYSAGQTPATKLHEPNGFTRCKRLAEQCSARAAVSRSHQSDAFVRHNAQAYGYQAAAFGAGLLRAIDVVVGTGVNTKGPFTLTSASDLCSHLGDVTAEFSDTGIAGVVTGSLVGLPMAIGATLGAAVACLRIAVAAVWRAIAARGARADEPRATIRIDEAAATGALMGAAAFGLIIPTYIVAGAWMATLGAARAHTGLIKATAVGALYGVGYATGYAVALMQLPGKSAARPADI